MTEFPSVEMHEYGLSQLDAVERRVTVCKTKDGVALGLAEFYGESVFTMEPDQARHIAKLLTASADAYEAETQKG
jgi:hypothetical protein